VVGSAIFNIMFVISVCALFAGTVSYSYFYHVIALFYLPRLKHGDFVGGFRFLMCAKMFAVAHHHHHFWHTPLGVCSTKLRHQSPEWTILTLSHIVCVIQE